ncbi:MAG TPA: dihydroorotase, partial [Nannocystis exedens]|nr:dihydroorotase [Nannocystis exedens]
LVMPNLRPPVRRLDDAIAYRQRILAALPESAQFEPLMTLYLTDETTPVELRAARDSGIVIGVKLYPAGATTNSAAGVRDLRAAPVERALAAMQELGLPLLVHGEVTDPEVDIFDREAVFIERILRPLCVRFPGLRVVLEHVTTTAGVDFVRQQSGDLVAATITAHHLLLNRNALLVGGLQPHHYCLPVLKRERHRRALVEAATSGDRRFFLGTDSAPHQRSAKESACGCAGCYTAHAAIELYAEAFAAARALAKLEAFASHHGPDFYGLPRNEGTITLAPRPWQVPASYESAGGEIVPLRAGAEIHWRVVARS